MASGEANNPWVHIGAPSANMVQAEKYSSTDPISGTLSGSQSVALTRNSEILGRLTPMGVYTSRGQYMSFNVNGKLSYSYRDATGAHDLLRSGDSFIDPLTNGPVVGTMNLGQPLVPTYSTTPPYWTDPGPNTVSPVTATPHPGLVDWYPDSGFVRVTNPVGYGNAAAGKRRTQINFPEISSRQRVAWDMSFRVPDLDDEPYMASPLYVYPFLFFQVKGAGHPSIACAVQTTDTPGVYLLRITSRMSSLLGDTDTYRRQWNSGASGYANVVTSVVLATKNFNKGEWVDLLLEAFLDERKIEAVAGGMGYLNAWVNGEQILTYSGPTMSMRDADGYPPPPANWGVGIYRHESDIPVGAYELDLNKETDPAPFRRVIDFRVCRMLKLAGEQHQPEGGIVGVVAEDVTLTGTTSETSLYSLTIPGYTLREGDVLSVHPVFSNNSSANNKTIRVRFGSSLAGATTVYSSVATTTVTSAPRVALRILKDIATQIGEWVASTGASAAEGFAQSSDAVVATAVNFKAEQTLYLSAQLANAADNLTLKSLIVRIERAIY